MKEDLTSLTETQIEEKALKALEKEGFPKLVSKHSFDALKRGGFIVEPEKSEVTQESIEFLKAKFGKAV